MFGQKKSKSQTVVQWIGEKVHIQKQNYPKILRNKVVRFYKQCIFGSMILTTNDYVLVLNADSAELDSEEGCDLGKILFLFEVLEPLQTERDYRALVQWYVRPSSISSKYFDDDYVAFDFDKEFIEDHRPFDNNICIESIVKKCNLVLGNEHSCTDDLLKRNKKIGPMFACRFKFIKTGARSFKLVPLGFINPDEMEKSKKSSDNKKIEKKDNIDPPILDKDLFNKENFDTPINIVNRSEITKKPPLKRLLTRNLNTSIDDHYNTSLERDCLNYSIVAESPVELGDPLKLKLRLSTMLPDQIEAVIPKSSAITETFETIKAKDVDKGKSKETTRKSILKPTDRKNLAGTPKRTIQMTNIVENKFACPSESVSSTPSRKRASRQHHQELDSDYTPSKKKSTPSKNKSLCKAEVPVIFSSRKQKSFKISK